MHVECFASAIGKYFTISHHQVACNRIEYSRDSGISAAEKSAIVTNPRNLVTNVITLPVLLPLFLAEKKYELL